MASRIFLLQCLLTGLFVVPMFSAQQLPEGKEKAIVAGACTKCHSLERIVAAHHTPEEWRDVVHRMVLNGAALTDDEAGSVVQYLQKNFGPASITTVLETSSAQSVGPQSGFKPVAGVYLLMEAIIIPASDVVWHVAAQPPTNEKEWKVVQHNALTLAEAGNLLMIGSRAKDKGGWMDAARRLIDSATVVFRMAEAKNVDGLNEAGNQLVEACRNCHVQYKINIR